MTDNQVYQVHALKSTLRLTITSGGQPRCVEITPQEARHLAKLLNKSCELLEIKKEC